MNKTNKHRHSLGGAVAGLISMNQAFKGNTYETHLFGAYGHVKQTYINININKQTNKQTNKHKRKHKQTNKQKHSVVLQKQLLQTRQDGQCKILIFTLGTLIMILFPKLIINV